MSEENKITEAAEEAAREIKEASEGAAEEAAEEINKASEKVEETVEEAKDAAEEAEAAAEEAVSDTAEEAEAAAEEAVNETAEEAVSEAADAAEEAVSDAAEEAEAAAAEAAEEVKKASAAADNAKQSAPAKKTNKNDVVIKKKSRLSTTNIILIIIIAVMALAIAAYVLYKEDVFKKWFPVRDSMTMEDYSTIEIERSDVEVSEEDVESYLADFTDEHSYDEDITDGEVEYGDVVNIDYVGRIDGEEFDGGTDEGYDLTIGSGRFIDGFEDGLVGAKPGETVVLDLTFPEDYTDSEDSAYLNGAEVEFTVTVNSITRTITPELTDEFVAENSLEHTGEQLDSIEALQEWYVADTYQTKLESAVLEALGEKQTVKSRSDSRMELLKNYVYQQLSYISYMYGYDIETIASIYGYESSEAYCETVAGSYCDTIMLIDYVCNDLGITYTDEQKEAWLQSYMDENGYSDYYTLEEFKESNGEEGMLLIEGIEMRLSDMVSALEDRVVLVDTADEESETTSAAE